MAALASAKPDVILIDQAQSQNEENVVLLSKPTKVHVHTGNIANWNSLKSRKTQLPANELYHSLHATIETWTKSIAEEEHVDGINCYNEETFESADERSLIKITVKIMIHEFNTTFLDEALNSVLKTLKIDYCDQLILSLPPMEDGVGNFGQEISPYWKKMEEFHRAGSTKQISSCDLDREKLESLLSVADIKPVVNQVNLTSCCHMPEDLVAFSKEAGIVLHTHGDQPVMLPNEKVNELIKSIDNDNNLTWHTKWIVRYAVVIKCRGVIKSKGYIASIQSYDNTG